MYMLLSMAEFGTKVTETEGGTVAFELELNGIS